MNPDEAHRGWGLGLRVGSLIVACVLSGCASRHDSLVAPSSPPKAQRTLAVSEFYDGGAKAQHQGVTTAGVSNAAATNPDASAEGTGNGSAASAGPSVAAPVGAGPSAASESTAANLPRIVIPKEVSDGGLVGQVNGRPIFVSEFFTPIEDRLRILGAEKPTMQGFVAEAFPLIRRQLAEFITNELIYAEAEASLTENERVGLRYLLQELEGDVTRARGRIAQDTQMRAESGIGVDEALELERRRQLIKYKIETEIRKRVIISWRDVQRYYRDHQAEFNPPPSIQLRLLAVKADDTAMRQEIEKSLDDGYLFGSLAESHSTLLASRGGLMEPIGLGRGLEQTPLTTWPEVDAVARTLKQGEYGGPVIAGDRAIWVYVEQYADGTGQSLYDVQHIIEKRLDQERFAEEEQKYLANLYARGNMDDFEDMAYLLLDIAVKRWAPAQ